MERRKLMLKELSLSSAAQGYANRFLKDDTQALLKEINEKVPADLVDDLKNAIKDELCIRFFPLLLNKTKPLIMPSGYTEEILSAAISPVVTGSRNNIVRLWDITNLNNIDSYTLKGRTGPTNEITDTIS